MRKTRAQVGTVWGRWTVVEELPRVQTPSGRFRPRVRVRCECGNEAELQTTVLVRGGSTQCRSCARRSVQVGERFDRLVVTGYSTVQDNRGRDRSLIECQCDCGNTVSIRANLLRQNQTNNCGCAPRGAWSGVGELSTTFFNRQARRASQKGHTFEVTPEYLWGLFLRQNRCCALSGLPLGFNLRTAGRNTASLDRIDSSGGYTEGNVQWVHKDINRMKLDHSVEHFVDLCRKVVQQADSG